MKNKKLNMDNLIGMISKSLGLKKDQINEKSSANNIEKWDSLGQLNILSSLDEFYDGKIADLPDIAKAISVELIYSELKKNSLIA